MSVTESHLSSQVAVTHHEAEAQGRAHIGQTTKPTLPPRQTRLQLAVQSLSAARFSGAVVSEFTCQPQDLVFK